MTVTERRMDRLAYAHDASHYALVPRTVIVPADTDEVAALLRTTRRAVTFRSGGTSLSGQGVTDDQLADTRRHFRAIRVHDGGATVSAQPGATVRQVNTRLLPFGRRLGPDPASEIACTIGGVVANNSSGMLCGTTENTYRTLESATLVLPSGTVIDTAHPDAHQQLLDREPAIHHGLLRLRDRIRADPESLRTIKRLYAIKNTMGYGLNSFVDYDEPLDILLRLTIGSEGTLAFVAEATFQTVALRPHLATALLIFADLAAATHALPALVAAGFAAIELLDSTSLRVAQRDPKATADLTGLDVVHHAALLVEFQETTAEALAERQAGVAALLDSLPLAAPAALSTDATRRGQLWHIRKGLFTLVAGARPPGTTALLEDIAVPVERLNATCAGLSRLFTEFGYVDSVIFGHARDGNIHFMINERFTSLGNYARFTDAMVDLVLGQGGTLKAEHGTGRMMAPFVRRQFGDELFEVMQDVKQLIDPRGILNPGVLLTDDPEAHLHDLKTTPTVETEVDRCVECGYCEPSCPSRDLTMTPRQRIVLRREMQHARAAGDGELVAELERDFRYDGVQTCAVDGMCQTACPVGIDTGDLVRRLRTEGQSATAQAGGRAAARHWAGVTRAAAVALTAADRVPAALPRAVTALGRRLLGPDRVRRYSADLPAGGRSRRARRATEPVAIYFSSCTTTMFGTADSFLSLCDRAGVPIATPSGLSSLCCGTPWKSKGLTAGYQEMTGRVITALRAATRDGAIPVVCDASSCTEGLDALLAPAGMTVVDSVVFAAESLLPRLTVHQRMASLTLHPTCSSARLGIDPALRALGQAVAETVVVPADWGCCAFAGDRGMLHPELTATATGREAAEVRDNPTTAYASLNRTCEIGMSRATGVPYRHVLDHLDQATQRKG